MSIGSMYKKIALSSPKAEVFLRKLYWNNAALLSRFSVNKTNRFHRTDFVDFEEIVNFLKECGIGEGSLVVMHSSYGNLKPTSLDNKGIIERLLELVGSTGTLAAPVIRHFKEEEILSYKDMLNDKVESIHCVYDIANTPITSGVLCSTLMKHSGSETSLFPLNPLTAVGLLAKEMMKGNLDGENPSAHGPNSCWKFCADHDAYIIYLGVNYGHHITMQQVVTECYPEMCPPDFYRKRSFSIVDGNTSKDVVVCERRHKWTMFLAEMNVNKDLAESGIVKMTNIKGIPVSVMRAQDLIEYYRKKGGYYPYFVK